MMRKNILIVIVMILPITYIYGKEIKENRFLIGTGGINIDNNTPHGIYLYGGYEYTMAQSSKKRHYWALEGRLTNGYFFEKSEYIDMVIGLSILPRIYLKVNYYDIFVFAEGEIGGNYQYVNSNSKNGGKMRLMYGTRVGVKSKNVSLWVGILETGAKKVINDNIDTNYVVHSIIDVFGISYYF